MIAALALLLCPPAAAGTALDGTSGLVRAPSTETVPAGRVHASLGLDLFRGYDGTRVSGLPTGFAAGLASRVEVGGHLDRNDRAPHPDSAPARGTLGLHLRMRPVDPLKGRPGFAVQAALSGYGEAPTGELLAIASLGSYRTALAVSGGPRLRADGLIPNPACRPGRNLCPGPRQGERPASPWTPPRPSETSSGLGLTAVASAGIEAAVGSAVLLAEQRAVLGRPEQSSLDGRIGVRLRSLQRLALLAWGGGGVSETAPWVGGGLAVQLSSSDPARQDTDDDLVPDRNDRCRYLPEDLDGFRDDDGCPDPDNDADGIPDAEDPTPDGEPEPEADALPGVTPSLKMRIKQRRLPGPIDPTHRRLEPPDAPAP